MKIHFIWLDIGSGHRPGVNHGLAWISAYLKFKGHRVSCQHIMDQDSFEKARKVVQHESPDCIGFSITTNQRRYLDPYAAAVRKNFKGLMIVGGVHPTLDPINVLKCPNIDGICIGEGEYPIAILLDHIKNGESYLETPSFWWKRKDGKTDVIVKNDVNPLETNLAEFPFPDYNIFDTGQINAGLGQFGCVMLSRGCLFNCSYCCNHAIKSVYSNSGKYVRILPVENSLQYLEEYRNKYPETKGFIFEDDVLMLNPKWFLRFSDGYGRRINLPYTCNARFEYLQKKELVIALKKSGCSMVMLGLESGDEEFRNKILKRDYSNQDIYNAVRLLKEVDLPYFTYNIFGFPFETKGQMQQTIAINKQIRPHSGQAFFFYPYPKTALYDLCAKHGLLDQKKMDEVSGYREKPVIKMTNRAKKDCVNAQQSLLLYFIARRFSRLISVDSSTVDKIIHSGLMLCPSLFVNLFTRENFIKRFLRILQYKKARTRKKRNNGARF